MSTETEIIRKERLSLLAHVGKLSEQVSRRHVNLWLYFGIAYFTAWTGFLSTDEAAKYVEPERLFWLRGFCTTGAAGLLGIKMVMSDAFKAESPKG